MAEQVGHSSEGARAKRGIFGIGSPPRDRTVTPVSPIPDVRPPVFTEPGKRPESPKKRIGKKTRIALAGLAAVGVAGVGAYEVYENVPALHRTVDSVPGSTSFNPERKIIDSREVFDPKATEGVISERNTIQMTREEYEKIAPPAIDRENLKEIPIYLPQDAVNATEPKTRKFTIEQNTSVNALIYVKTPEGDVRKLTYEKVTNPAQITGQTSSSPSCNVLLGLDGEIQPEDKFPSPISGIVYHHGGEKSEDGAITGGAYYIEGEYLDPKTGEKFRVNASINSASTPTKPLIENMPRLDDFIKGITWRDAVKNMPKVTVHQGENLFKFISKPSRESIAWGGPRSQMVASFNYEGDLNENDLGRTIGGENCTNSTVDGKAIVIK